MDQYIFYLNSLNYILIQALLTFFNHKIGRILGLVVAQGNPQHLVSRLYNQPVRVTLGGEWLRAVSQAPLPRTDGSRARLGTKEGGREEHESSGKEVAGP